MQIGLMRIIGGRTQPRRGDIFIVNHNIITIEPRRGEIFVANNQDNKPQPRRGGIIIKYNTFKTLTLLTLTRRIVALDSGLKLISKLNNIMHPDFPLFYILFYLLPLNIIFFIFINSRYNAIDNPSH